MQIFSKTLTALVLLLSISAAVSCTPRTEKSTLPLDVTVPFSESGVREIPDRWWTAFEDQKLNELVEQALQSNFNLGTTWYRLQQARAVVDRQSSELYPELEGLLGAEMTRSDTGDNEQLQLEMLATYEVDLWGRIRSSVEAEAFRARATLADYQTAALSLSAEIVLAWYRLQEAQSQLELLEEQIETNTTLLTLIRNRLAAGQVRGVDLLRQKQLLEATREQRLIVESRAGVLEHQLAVLLGVPPQRKIQFSDQNILPDPPPLPDTGLPAALLRRRPDVQSAYLLVKAADRDLAAAISNQYPRVDLAASLGTAGENPASLFENWIVTLSSSLLAPLYDAGRREAEVDRSEALKAQRISEYGQSVLDAFQEVEDALLLEKKQVQRLRSLEQQVSLLNQAYEQLRFQYLNGARNFLDVLSALTEEQQLRRELLSARLDRLEQRVALYRALAGGFETDRESDPEIGDRVENRDKNP